MKSQGIYLAAIAGVISLALSGCAGDSSVYSVSDAIKGAHSKSYGAGGNSSFISEGSELTHEDHLAQKTFLFGFDRFNISESEYDALNAHASYLEMNPNAHIRVEGHTDNKGSREYNVALGERRAKSVANVLMSQGAERYQIKIVSYGEEKPAAEGSSDEAYRLNRRAELVYY